MVAMPPGAEVDMNNVTLRISLDVTGLVGFAKDFETCASFSDSGTDELFTIIQKSELPTHISMEWMWSSLHSVPVLIESLSACMSWGRVALPEAFKNVRPYAASQRT